MRKRFDAQLSLGTIPIGEVEIDLKSRHELPPVLAGLQHIFVTPDLHEQVFLLLEAKMVADKQRTGRYGMHLWEVFVLAVVRLCLNADYDRLVDLANNHATLRGILGVQVSDFTLGRQYCYQTVVDNVSVLDHDLLEQINEIVVKSGHRILKKKKGPKKKN